MILCVQWPACWFVWHLRWLKYWIKHCSEWAEARICRSPGDLSWPQVGCGGWEWMVCWLDYTSGRPHLGRNLTDSWQITPSFVVTIIIINMSWKLFTIYKEKFQAWVSLTLGLKRYMITNILRLLKYTSMNSLNPLLLLMLALQTFETPCLTFWKVFMLPFN